MFTQEELTVILELVQAEESWYECEEEDTQARILASIVKKINIS